MDITQLQNSLGQIVGTQRFPSGDARTTAETRKTETTIQELAAFQQDIKNQTGSIKSANDRFGALKTAEKTLKKVDDALSGGEGFQAALQLLQNAQYKGESLFANLPIDGKSVDLLTSLVSGSEESFSEVLSGVKTAVDGALTQVKEEIRGQSDIMGNAAQSGMDHAGVKFDARSVAAHSDIEYLKSRMQDLLK